MGRRALAGTATGHIAARLRKAREDKGWSLDRAAEEAHVSRSTIDRAESGAVAIAVEALMLIAPALDLDPASLVSEAAALSTRRDAGRTPPR